jgi:hypothetical protein
MKSQDIVILFKLLCVREQEESSLPGSAGFSPAREDPYSVRGLGSSLGIGKTEIGASLNRSVQAALAIKDQGRTKPNRRNLFEFISHGIKYVFPATPGAPQRGIPTAFGAPMLEGQLISGGEEIYVWPYARGKQRGLSVMPLFQSVPQAVLLDERLYEYLALVDAIRIGRQREANLAVEILREKLLQR